MLLFAGIGLAYFGLKTPSGPPMTEEQAASGAELILGKWEGCNERGRKEGLEFTAEGVARIRWDGRGSLTGRYRLGDQDSIEVSFGLMYKFRARFAVTANQLVLTIPDDDKVKETVYQRVPDWSFRTDANGGSKE
jgi:hypothetical protein